MRVEREVVGDERCVAAEERLEPAAQPRVDDERLVAPEEAVVDEHELGAEVDRPLEELPRARDAAGDVVTSLCADHLEPLRGELREALDLEQLRSRSATISSLRSHRPRVYGTEPRPVRGSGAARSR